MFGDTLLYDQNIVNILLYNGIPCFRNILVVEVFRKQVHTFLRRVGIAFHKLAVALHMHQSRISPRHMCPLLISFQNDRHFQRHNQNFSKF